MAKFRVEELLFPSHILDLIELAKRFTEEEYLEGDEYIDEDIAVASCHDCIKDVTRKHQNAYIAYVDDKPVGFVIGVTTRAFYRNLIVAEQKLWYVVPEARRTRVALMLLDEYEKWARINGASHIYTGTANPQLAEKTSKLFEHKGFERVGTIHLKKVVR